MPAEETKHYRIDFFTGHVTADENQGRLADVLDALIARAACPAWKRGGYAYELRDLLLTGQVYRGVLAKLRSDQLPHAGQLGGVERELDLAEEEGLIEKNFFLYYSSRNLLVYQRNGNASRSQRFAEYLTDFWGRPLPSIRCCSRRPPRA